MPVKPFVLAAAFVASAVIVLAGCASQAPAGAGHAGVGTPGITSYAQAAHDPDVRALEARCRRVPRPAGPASDARGMQAACAQLGRLMHTQPGNSARPSPPE